MNRPALLEAAERVAGLHAVDMALIDAHLEDLRRDDVSPLAAVGLAANVVDLRARAQRFADIVAVLRAAAE